MNARAFLYFAIHRAISSGVRDNYQELLQLEGGTVGSLQQIQCDRLNRLLQRTAQRVPYYVERVPSKRSLAITDFPILTKDEIRGHFAELMTPELHTEYVSGRRSHRYSWLQVQTGGTTGVPTTVIHSPEYRDRGRAGRLYSQYLCGFPLGTPYLRLWGSMREINEMRSSYQQMVLQRLHNETLLNAFTMSEREMDAYLKIINSSRAQHMMAYVDAAVELAQHARRKRLPVRQLKSIMACAGTVTPDVRRVLEEVFGARVHNQYGSRDCAGIACECERGGHHVYANHLFLESVDDQGRTVPHGQSGRLLVTLLHNFSFPLVRYEIGDIGVLTRDLCRCGRPYPLLQTVEGRAVEFLRSTSGAYVSPVYIRHLIGVVHNPGVIRRFQLVQYSLQGFELRYERAQDCPLEDERRVLKLIETDLRTVLGADCDLRIVRLEEIPRSASGKFLYTKRSFTFTATSCPEVVGG